MKKITTIFFALLTIASYAQVDRSKAPEPGPAPEIKMGKYDDFTLDNGLKVIVVENRKLPIVSAQLSFDNDPVLEGDKAGASEIMGSLMKTGTANRSKSEIDQAVDFIGATLRTSDSGIFSRSLKKHTPDLMEILADVLQNPTFPEDELEKQKSQIKSGLAAAKNDAEQMAASARAALNYGHDHPYGEQMTEKTVDNITRDDLVEYYSTYIAPNTSYLVLVGDIDVAEAKELANKYFGSWEKKDVPEHKYDTPQPPESRRVAFVDKAGAVQSVINVTYPVVLYPGIGDEIAASVMNNILGGGVFSGRLMQNLREDKAYTYGARSNLSNDELVASFNAYASVRNEVSDSSVVEFLAEMERIVNEPVDKKHLELVKDNMTGVFALGLERPQTIARYAMNIEKYNLPKDYYNTYLERLSEITVEDVQKAAKKYIKPNNATLLVVGNKGEVAEKLERFSASGSVEFYDMYGYPVEDKLRPAPEGVTAESVIESYLDALTKKRKTLEKVSSLETKSSATIQGMAISARTVKQENPNRFLTKMEASGMTLQEVKYDGEKAKRSSMQGVENVEDPEELKGLKLQSFIFPEMHYADNGYTLELIGIDEFDGRDVYQVDVTSPDGEVESLLFDVESGLKVKSTSIQDGGPQGQMVVEILYQDYKEVKKIKFPHTVVQSFGPQEFKMEIKEINLNPKLGSDTFQID